MDWPQSASGHPDHRQNGFYLVLLAALPFLIFADALFSPLKAIGGDNLQLYWPDLVYLFNSLRDGHFPLWDPYERAGDPFISDPQNGIFYPLNYLFIAAAMLLGKLSFTLQEIKVLVHLAIAGTGMFVFLQRKLKLAPSAAFIGALVFLLQPYFAGHIRHILLLPAAYLPWILFTLHAMRHQDSFRALGAFSLLCGIVLVAGSPPGAWYTLLFAALYALFLLSQPSPVIGRLRFVGMGICGLLCALMISCVVWLPALQHIPFSVVENRSFDYLSSMSLRLHELKHLVIAGPTSEERWVYIGFVPVLLALGACVQRRLRHQVLFWWLVATFFLLVLVGRELPAFRVLSALPGFDLFRHPVRYILLPGAALSILAGIGLDTLQKALYSRLNPVSVSARMARWGIPIGVSVLIMATLAPPMRTIGLQTLKQSPSATNAKAIEMNGLARDWRMLDEGYISNGPGDRLSLRDFRGYATNFVYFRWAKVRQAMRHRPELLSLYNVRYYGPHPTDFHATVPRIGNKPGWSLKSPGLYENPTAWPAAFWTPAARLVRDHKQALQQLKYTKTFSAEAILERNQLPSSDIPQPLLSHTKKKSPEPVTIKPAKIISLSSNMADVEVNAASVGLLIVNETWYPGWTAWLGERKLEVFPANYLQRAVVVPAGRHRVHFEFQPDNLTATLIISVLGLLAAILLLFMGKRFHSAKIQSSMHVSR